MKKRLKYLFRYSLFGQLECNASTTLSCHTNNIVKKDAPNITTRYENRIFFNIFFIFLFFCVCCSHARVPSDFACDEKINRKRTKKALNRNIFEKKKIFL